MGSSLVKNNDWVLVDVSNMILGRVASKIVGLLIGKHIVGYNYNLIIGNQVIVINAQNIRFTGNKMFNKIYYRHSGYPGGLKAIKLKDLFLKNPALVLKIAINGMLPKNKLRKIFLKRIKIYSGNAHPHICQKPQKLAI